MLLAHAVQLTLHNPDLNGLHQSFSDDAIGMALLPHRVEGRLATILEQHPPPEGAPGVQVKHQV
jgi:hypothetical protein